MSRGTTKETKLWKIFRYRRTGFVSILEIFNFKVYRKVGTYQNVMGINFKNWNPFFIVTK